MKLVELKKKKKKLLFLAMDIYKTVSRRKLNKETHLSTGVQCSLSKYCRLQLYFGKKNKSGARIWKKQFGKSLEDEVCNAERLFFFLFISQFCCCFVFAFLTFCARIKKQNQASISVNQRFHLGTDKPHGKWTLSKSSAMPGG